MIFTWYQRFLTSFQTGTCGTHIHAGALPAPRLACHAILPAKANPLAINVLPKLPWQKLEKVLLDLPRRLLVRELQTMRDTEDMRINGNSLDFSETFVQDDVGSFAPYARKPLQFLHSLRNLTTEIGHDHAGAVDAVARLIVMKADGPDDFFELVNIGLRHLRRCRPTLKEDGSDLVDVGVRSLRGKRNGNHALKGVAKIERWRRLRIELVHARTKLDGSLALFGLGFAWHSEPP